VQKEATVCKSRGRNPNSQRATKGDNLLWILGKKVCLAPLAAGGTLGVAQLAQGQYVPACLSTVTGSAMP
jgi:hypothetical protein